MDLIRSTLKTFDHRVGLSLIVRFEFNLKYIKLAFIMWSVEKILHDTQELWAIKVKLKFVLEETTKGFKLEGTKAKLVGLEVRKMILLNS